MCNLYSITTNQAAIIALFRVVNRYVAGVFLDYPAPVVRNTETGRELSMMRWGMPPPPRQAGRPSPTSASSPHWAAGSSHTRRWKRETLSRNSQARIVFSGEALYRGGTWALSLHGCDRFVRRCYRRFFASDYKSARVRRPTS
jgi:hypothetical protein